MSEDDDFAKAFGKTASLVRIANRPVDEWKARAEAAEAAERIAVKIYRELVESTRRCEASCAAMRQALVEARKRALVSGGFAVEVIDAALRSDAGAALLAERDRLREAVRRLYDAAGDTDPARGAWVDALDVARAALGEP